MVNVAPFKGILYSQEKIKDLSQVVTPPYDVIASQEQEKFYRRNERNFVRLILGEPNIERDYNRSADDFSAWVKEGVLVQDPQPAIYLYQQQFDHRGQKKTRLGFIALLALEDFSTGNVLPHENTLSKPKADRLNLLRATGVNFEQIFFLYQDKDGTIRKILGKILAQNPDIDIDDDAQINHKLWRITDEKSIKSIVQGMKDKKVFIADGHHRYETSLNYYSEKKDKAYGYIAVGFVALEDPGIVIFPTHRLLKGLSNSELQQLASQIGKYFTQEKVKSIDVLLEKMDREGKSCFGLYYKGAFYLLILKDFALVDEVLTKGSDVWRHLEVNILHKLLLDSFIGSAEKIKEGKIAYKRDEREAVKLVDSGEYQLAFFLRSTKVEEVKDVSLAGEKMPQKSTFFYPKLLSGLVMHKLG